MTYLINASKWGRRGSFGTLVAAAFETGRPGAGSALAFQASDAKVRLMLDMRMPAFSLATWMRLDAVPTERPRGIFMSDGVAAGAVHWSVGTDGSARLECVGMDGVRRFTSSSGETLPAPDGRRWVHVAVTVENGLVKHYVNGRPVGTEVWAGFEEVYPNRLSLGNWQGAERENPRAGCLHGLLDDFVLFHRALKPSEVARLYGEQTR